VELGPDARMRLGCPHPPHTRHVPPWVPKRAWSYFV
jgi:hypothetical protein